MLQKWLLSECTKKKRNILLYKKNHFRMDIKYNVCKCTVYKIEKWGRARERARVKRKTLKLFRVRYPRVVRVRWLNVQSQKCAKIEQKHTHSLTHTAHTKYSIKTEEDRNGDNEKRANWICGKKGRSTTQMKEHGKRLRFISFYYSVYFFRLLLFPFFAVWQLWFSCCSFFGLSSAVVVIVFVVICQCLFFSL